VFEGSGWDHHVASSLSELKVHLNSLVQNCKDKLIAKLSTNA
jgi:hypothetical protein